MIDKPNILCIVSEDCPPRLGAYGDRLAHSPNLDRLARQGVVFETANCTSPVCAPSRFAILTGLHAETCPRAQHMRAVAELPPILHTYPETLRAAGYYCTNNAKTDYNCAVVPSEIWDESSRTAHWRNRSGDQPFLAVFNSMVTHESCVFEQQDGPVGPDAVSLPSYLPDTPGMRRSLARQYNAIARMDAELGARLDELDEDGLADDTIVFYFSDHGSVLPRSKRYLYDEGLRVPLIVRVPDKWRHLLPHPPGSHVNRPVSLVDLFPTFAAIAGIEVPEGLHGQPFLGPDRKDREFVFAGRDRMGERYDLARTVRSKRYRYIRNYAPHRIWGQYVAYEWMGVHYQDYEIASGEGVLDPVQARFWETKPAEEFYDMEADPDATVNLAGDPAHADALDAHRVALDTHMRAIYDTGFIPEHSPVETWQASRDAALYPLDRVMALAQIAIRRDPANRDALLAALGGNSPVMRHWAARGVLMLAAEGHDLPPGVAAAFESESDEQVRIPLAEALGRGDEPERWVRYLTDTAAAHPDPRIKLQALESLTWLPLQPEISLATVSALRDHDDTYVRQSADFLAQKIDGTYSPRNQVFDMERLAEVPGVMSA